MRQLIYFFPYLHEWWKKPAKYLIYFTLIIIYLINIVASVSAMEKPETVDRRKVHILTIDGGGIPGIIPATILEAMEEILQSELGINSKEARLSDCFDLMVGSSTGALSVLFLTARDKENKLYRADKLYEFYELLYASPSNHLSVLAQYFGNRWLSEASTPLLIPVYNDGQTLTHFFDTNRANKLPSQNFKMCEIAQVSMLSPTLGKISIKSQREEESGKEATDYTFHNAEKTHPDITIEVLLEALERYPNSDLFIVSLGIGEIARAFGSREGYKFDTLFERTIQDRHIFQLKKLIKTLKRLGKKVDYIRIQLTLETCTTRDKNALRQAGLYISNPSGRNYDAFQAITQELIKAYQEKSLSNKVSQNSDSEEMYPRARSWKKVAAEVLDNLREAPSIERSNENYPEGQSKSYLTQLWEQLHKNQNVTITSRSKAALLGVRGVGKTYLASQYAHEALANQAYKLIYWLASETEGKLKESYKSLLDLFDVKVKKDSNLRNILTLVNGKLSKYEPYLLIYDNVPDSRFLDNKIPTRKGHILITSRCQEGWSNSIILKIFQPKEEARSLNAGAKGPIEVAGEMPVYSEESQSLSNSPTSERRNEDKVTQINEQERGGGPKIKKAFSYPLSFSYKQWIVGGLLLLSLTILCAFLYECLYLGLCTIPFLNSPSNNNSPSLTFSPLPIASSPSKSPYNKEGYSNQTAFLSENHSMPLDINNFSNLNRTVSNNDNTSRTRSSSQELAIKPHFKQVLSDSVSQINAIKAWNLTKYDETFVWKLAPFKDLSSFIEVIRPTPHTTQSESYFLQLGNKLHNNNPDYLGDESYREVAITARWGEGKKHLVHAYANFAYQNKFYQSIFWIEPANRINIIQNYRSILNFLTYPNNSTLTYDEYSVVQKLKQALKGKKTLWIYVGADSRRDIEDLFVNEGHNIITSRHSKVRAGWADSISLQRFNLEESITYLLKRLNLKWTYGNYEPAKVLALNLECFPFSLARIASYMEMKLCKNAGIEKVCNFNEAINIVKDNSIELIEHEDFQSSYPVSAINIWQASTANLSPTAKTLIAYWSYIDEIDIPLSLFRSSYLFQGKEKLFKKAVKELADYSLIEDLVNYVSIRSTDQKLQKDILKFQEDFEAEFARPEEILLDLFKVFLDKVPSLLETDFNNESHREGANIYLGHLLRLVDYSKSLNVTPVEYQKLAWMVKALYTGAVINYGINDYYISNKSDFLYKKRYATYIDYTFLASNLSQEGLNWLIEVSERANPSFQVIIGNMFLIKANAVNLQEDYNTASQAFTWFNKAVSSNYNKGLINAAFMLAHGWGVNQNVTLAENYYLKAAEDRDPEAQYWLGILYGKVWGRHEDAFLWINKSAQQGYLEAQCQLGLLYVAGAGVDREYEKGINWIKQAAKQGHSRARKLLIEEGIDWKS
jgi:hypothetical protein